MRLTTLLITFVLAFASTTTALAQRLHAVLVADTDSSVRDAVRRSIDDLDSTLRNGLPADRLRVIRVTGNDVTADHITRLLRRLVIDRNDAVMMFYAGHGAFHREHGHYLDLTHGRALYRSKLEESITEPVTPRFWALITECCAAIPPVAAAPVFRPDKYTLLTHLFLETTGRLDITSSRPGQLSWAGVFTLSFCEVLTDNSHRELNWDDVFHMTRERSSEIAESVVIPAWRAESRQNRHYSAGIEQRTQTPYSFKTMYGQNVNGLRFGIHHENRWITSVERGSPAANAGLARGMRVLSVNGQQVNSDNQLVTAINFSPRVATVVVQGESGRRTIEVELAY